MKRIKRAVVLSALLAVQPAVGSAMSGVDQVRDDALPRINRLIAFHHEVSASVRDACEGAPSGCTNTGGPRDNRVANTNSVLPAPTRGPSD